MIKIYINRGRDSNVKKVLTFFDSYQLSYKFVGGKTLTREELKKILSLTDLGFEEILVSKSRAKQTYSKLSVNPERFTTGQFIDYILVNQELLRSPIVFNDNFLSVGFDQELLRTFVPKVRSRRKSL